MRELNYHMTFLACAVHLSDREGFSARDESDENTLEEVGIRPGGLLGG